MANVVTAIRVQFDSVVDGESDFDLVDQSYLIIINFLSYFESIISEVMSQDCKLVP